MKKLVLGALFVGLAACSKSSNGPTIMIVDGAGGDSSTAACNVLTQTGCTAGEKCTWLEDSAGSGSEPALGHIGCAPDGTAATGAACTYGAPGATGYDNCVGGDVCSSAKCKTICDQAGGAPMCANGFACATYDGLFGPAGQAVAAGVCDATCDPLADNDYDGSGSASVATGTACSTGQGCYGFPNDYSQTQTPSHFSCTDEVNTTLYHRSPCTTANGCANSAGDEYLNGCAEGYLPLLYDAIGSMQVDCIAMCAPKNCYSGNCGNNNDEWLTGNDADNVAGNAATVHQCNNQHELGTFDSDPPSGNGDQCMFSWVFEQDETTGDVHISPTSNSIGFCVDHTKVQYDGTGAGSANTLWPICNSLTSPGIGTGSAVDSVCDGANGCVGAGFFGCVDSITAGATNAFSGKAATRNHVIIDRPRMLYHRMMHQ